MQRAVRGSAGEPAAAVREATLTFTFKFLVVSRSGPLATDRE